MTIKIHLLKQVAYFTNCSADELNEIKKYIVQKNVQKGEIFLLEGHWCDWLYFVISGVVKVYKESEDGKQQILNLARVGESLNDVSTFDDSPNAASMVAMSPVVLYAIKKTDLKQFVLPRCPQVILNIFKVFATRVRRDSELLGDLAFYQVTGRLAKVLLRYTRERPIEGVKLTQQDMAYMVGTSREMVNKSLRTLEMKGAISMQRDGINVINKNALEEIMRASR